MIGLKDLFELRGLELDIIILRESLKIWERSVDYRNLLADRFLLKKLKIIKFNEKITVNEHTKNVKNLKFTAVKYNILSFLFRSYR